MKNKNYFLLLTLSLLFAQIAQAQLCIKSVSLTAANDLEMINGLSGDLLMSTVKEGLPFDQIPFEQVDLESMNCENPSLRVGIYFGKEDNESTMMYLGASWITNRYDGVSYYNEEFQNYFGINSYTNQVGAEFTYEKRLKLGFVNLYGGLGTTVGFSYSGDINVLSQNLVYDPQSNDLLRMEGGTIASNPNSTRQVEFDSPEAMEDWGHHSYKSKNSFDQRLFLQAGIGFRIMNRVEIGLQGRFGYAYRTYGQGQKLDGTLTSLGLSTKYIIQNCH